MSLPDDWLSQLKAVAPKRSGGHGWGAVPRLVQAAVSNGAHWPRILLGAQNYAHHCRKKGIEGTEFVMMMRTLVGRDQHWDEWADMDTRSPAEIAQERLLSALAQRAAKVGFRSPRANEPAAAYESCLRDVERERDRGTGQPKFAIVGGGR